MATPQFSVIITCHNQRKFIADAIQSAISQIYESREVIVVDDASSDGSDSVLKSYGEMIRLISLERNEGASEARNAGTAAARGNYLVYLDGDDLLKPWALLVYDQIIDVRKPALILSNLTWFQGSVPWPGEIDTPSQIEFVSYENWIQKDRPFRSSASALVVERQVLSTVRGTRKCDCAGYLEPGIIVASGNTGTPIRRLLAEVTNLRCLA
jgi:glycosyltransferase involved in cell wall biosynthesis